MNAECSEVEHALSYFRRLAQARIEILEAEHERRERGGSVEDLVADLPRILSAESGRSIDHDDPGVPAARAADDRAALARRPRAARRRHHARPAPAATRLDELESTIESSAATSSASSPTSARAMHGVIDAIDRVIVDRQVAGTAG